MPEETPFDPEMFTAQARETWNDLAHHYEAISLKFFPGITRSFLHFADLPENGDVLDVACGAGMATLAAALLIGPKGRVTGVDLSPGMLALARVRAEQRRYGNVEFQESNAAALDFPNKSFDAVICQLGLMLFAQPGPALREMARVTRRGGSVSCLVQGLGENMKFTSIIMTALLKKAPQLKIPGGPMTYAFAPPGTLREAFTGVGLADPEEKRIAGTFDFDSPEEYWDTMSTGAGRIAKVLAELSPADQGTVHQDVLKEVSAYASADHIEVPYEFVMARGRR